MLSLQKSDNIVKIINKQVDQLFILLISYLG